ncbi:MAG TPA: hypothetical protein VGZ22_29335 [Isosphaeraceae bacterium]|jgi:hypothetical protein|nr:hypothetical protein [Isosphaeraceae bacterium]
MQTETTNTRLTGSTAWYDDEIVRFFAILLIGLFFSVMNWLWHCKTDYLIASALGGVEHDPASGWTAFWNMDWTWSSLLGPVMSVATPAMLLLLLYSGLVTALLLINLLTKRSRRLDTHYWILISAIAVWLIRVPVPIQNSLFYYVCTKY